MLCWLALGIPWQANLGIPWAGQQSPHQSVLYLKPLIMTKVPMRTYSQLMGKTIIFISPNNNDQNYGLLFLVHEVNLRLKVGQDIDVDDGGANFLIDYMFAIDSRREAWWQLPHQGIPISLFILREPDGLSGISRLWT